MEHKEKLLPIDSRLLGALTEKLRAFAKALHYKEMEFEVARSKKMVESLIHINNQLQQHENISIGSHWNLDLQQHLEVQLKEYWYEKLQQWDKPLKAYTEKSTQSSDPHHNLDAILDRWDELSNLCKEHWNTAEPVVRLEIAPMAASATWNMVKWDQMSEYVSKMDDGDERKLHVIGSAVVTSDVSSNGAFFRSVLLVRLWKFDEAREYVERATNYLAPELAALVIDYCTLPVANEVTDGWRNLIRNMWNERIRDAKHNVEVWKALLVIR